MTEQATRTIESEERFRIVGEPAPLFEALSKAMPKFKPIERNKTVRVQPKDHTKAPYEFSYAPLEELVDATRVALAENGLIISQPYHSARGGWLLRTILAHTSGAYIEAIDLIPGGERTSNQDLGGILTYRRRYSYSAILGLTSEDDDDANAADGNAAVQVRKGEKSTVQQQGRGRGTAQQNFGPPPDWPDKTTVDQVCKWVDGLAINLFAFKHAWDLFVANKTLRFNALDDWEPMLTHFGKRFKYNVDKRWDQFGRGMSEPDYKAFVAEISAEKQRVDLERQSINTFGNEPDKQPESTGTDAQYEQETAR